MNIERFAGDNKVMQEFSNQIARNQQLMKTRQSEAMENAYQSRARDVAATGVSDAGSFL
jgi:hypothetical protein